MAHDDKKNLFFLALLALTQAGNCHAVAFAPLKAHSATDRPLPERRQNMQAGLRGPLILPAEEKTAQLIHPDGLALPEPESTPQIIYDPSLLPDPVRRMREKIIAAASTGNIEALRPLLAANGKTTQIQPASVPEDPIAYLKDLSGDSDGLEILAIVIDLLHSGCVHLGAGSRQDMYVWPYFVAVPLDKLSKPQLVEAYRIMTANDFETIKEIGSYIYFRIGIAPDGAWRFFVTGDQSEQQPG